jgi:hypothetical protein
MKLFVLLIALFVCLAAKCASAEDRPLRLVSIDSSAEQGTHKRSLIPSQNGTKVATTCSNGKLCNGAYNICCFGGAYCCPSGTYCIGNMRCRSY